MVDVVLENKKENAYNASLLLCFSNNLHFSSLALQVWGHGGIPQTCMAPPPVYPRHQSPSSPVQTLRPIPGQRLGFLQSFIDPPAHSYPQAIPGGRPLGPPTDPRWGLCSPLTPVLIPSPPVPAPCAPVPVRL